MLRILRVIATILGALVVTVTSVTLLATRASGAVVNDHLVPIPKGPDSRYNELLAKFLFKTSGNLGRIVVCPSGRGEESFSLDSIEKNSDEITLVRAHNSIWGAAFELDPHLRIDPSVRVTRITAAIPKPLASALSIAIRHAVQGIRPITPTEAVPLDGTSIFFFSPPAGRRNATVGLLDPAAQGASIHALRTLVNLLEDYCVGPSQRRNELGRRIEAEARRVQAK